jgi:nitrile hydratase subunit beta
MTLDLSHARPHDLGGQPAGPIDRSEHALEPWHKLVTALLGALRDPNKLVTVDEMRRAMEDMPPEDYRRLEYFERWAVGVATLVVEKGLMTREELAARLAAFEAKQ